MDRETQATYAVIAGIYADTWRDRTRIAADLDAFLAALPSGGMVLDLGCGPGYDGQRLADAGCRVLGLDLSAPMLQAGRARGVTISAAVADMRRLPLPADALDGIWLNAALLHLPRHEAPLALAECARALRPGGLLHVAVKVGEGEGHSDESYGRPCRRFFTYWQPAKLDTALEAAGFKIERRTQNPAWLTRLGRQCLSPLKEGI